MRKLKLLVFFLFYSFSLIAQNNTKVFQPNLFEGIPNVRDIALTTNEEEMYFTAQSIKQDFSAIMVSTKSNARWSKPEVASFSGQYKDIEPFLNPDGLTLYFASNRPVEGRESENDNYDIWKVERISLSSQWSTPINLGAPINTEADEFFPSVAANGNMYFTATLKNGIGKEDIFVSEFIEGVFTSPSPLPEAINSEGYEFNAFIYPDESFIIFTGYRREGGLGRGDLYISKKDLEGKWLEAQHLEINSTGIDYCPFVKEGVLYFTSDRSDLKPKYGAQMSTLDFLNELNKTENGKSRIYHTELEPTQ